MKICSACLLGINCRYNHEPLVCDKILQLAKQEILIPVCPEQLGGLATPRDPAEQIGDEVITKSGANVTQNFVQGAKEVLKIAQFYGIKEAILKQKSPSCGSGKVYDGSFTNKIIEGYGVTAKLLCEHGFKVISEEDL
jgi:uncharacterized protein YbbK (DUF523 family)